jgi:hypothetical protein
MKMYFRFLSMESERMAVGRTLSREASRNSQGLSQCPKLMRETSSGIAGWGTLRNVINAFSMEIPTFLE